MGFIYDCILIPCLLGMVKSRYPTNTGVLPPIIHPMGQILSVVNFILCNVLVLKTLLIVAWITLQWNTDQVVKAENDQNK